MGLESFSGPPWQTGGEGNTFAILGHDIFENIKIISEARFFANAASMYMLFPYSKSQIFGFLNM